MSVLGTKKVFADQACFAKEVVTSASFFREE